MPKNEGQNSENMKGAAAPTVGEIEGRLLVLELVALSSMTRLLSLHDGKEKADLIAEILRDIELNGRNSGLKFRDIMGAQSYAEEILREAQIQSDDVESAKHAFPKKTSD